MHYDFLELARVRCFRSINAIFSRFEHARCTLYTVRQWNGRFQLLIIFLNSELFFTNYLSCVNIKYKNSHLACNTKKKTILLNTAFVTHNKLSAPLHIIRFHCPGPCQTLFIPTYLPPDLVKRLENIWKQIWTRHKILFESTLSYFFLFFTQGIQKLTFVYFLVSNLFSFNS